jgi:hypothetical protein
LINDGRSNASNAKKTVSAIETPSPSKKTRIKEIDANFSLNKNAAIKVKNQIISAIIVVRLGSFTRAETMTDSGKTSTLGQGGSPTGFLDDIWGESK